MPTFQFQTALDLGQITVKNFKIYTHDHQIYHAPPPGPRKKSESGKGVSNDEDRGTKEEGKAGLEVTELVQAVSG